MITYSTFYVLGLLQICHVWWAVAF